MSFSSKAKLSSLSLANIVSFCSALTLETLSKINKIKPIKRIIFFTFIIINLLYIKLFNKVFIISHIKKLYIFIIFSYF